MRAPPAPQSPGADPLQGIELLCLVGTTATGKSELALSLAERLGAEIVSLDSMLVYRGMDVGTAKPGAPMRARVPHHMLDLVGPAERYDVQRFLADLSAAVAGLRARGARPLFVGGTAFYLKCLVHGLFAGPTADPGLRARLERELAELGAEAMHARLAAVDPAAAARIHPHDARRLVRALEVEAQTGRPLSAWQREWGWHGGPAPSGRPRRVVGLRLADAELDRRIAARTRAMLEGGWPEEVRGILEGSGFGPTAVQALGYREVIELVRGRLSLAECDERVRLRTRQFARRQRTWYRRFEEIRWLDAAADPGALLEDALGVLDPTRSAARRSSPPR